MLKDTSKIALLIFGFLPYIYFILFFTIIGVNQTTDNLFFYILAILTAISIPSVFIIYLVNVYRKKNITKENKYLWTALLFFGNIIVYPFYWYLHIWRMRKQV
jgi:ABC-type antimicrobial peptide transport system permease subunit